MTAARVSSRPMLRITGRSPERAGPLLRFVTAFARRGIGRMTGRTPDGMLAPFYAYALLPRVLLSYGMLEGATAGLRHLPERLRLLAELKAATVTTCEYCIDMGSQIARRAGLSDEELLALARHRQSGLFTDVEKLVMDYAVGMTRTPVEVPDVLFERLRAHLNEAQIVELTHVIALENLRGRFNLALGIGSAGFSEGMVCALPDAAPST